MTAAVGAAKAKAYVTVAVMSVMASMISVMLLGSS